MSGLEAVTSVLLPRSLADATQGHLREAGKAGSEGLVVWSGIQDGTVFRVKTVTRPEQRPIRTEGGVCVIVDGNALHALNVWLHKSGERLIAQVHSHPTHAFHSSMDDDYAVVTKAGSLSLVVPDFAERPFTVSECAIFRLSSQGSWVEIAASRARALIQVMPEVRPDAG